MEDSQIHPSDVRPKRPLRRPWQFSLRTALIAMAIVGVLLATQFFWLVDFRYANAVDKNPLVAPIRVAEVDGHKLLLSDGRALDIEEWRWLMSPSEAIARSGHEIDIEECEPGKVQVFVKAPMGYCGNVWMPSARMIHIPLVPDNLPLHRRSLVATAVVGRARDDSDALANSLDIP